MKNDEKISDFRKIELHLSEDDDFKLGFICGETSLSEPNILKKGLDFVYKLVANGSDLSEI